MIEQELREIASHIKNLQRQQCMFIEELRTLRDNEVPGLSYRLAVVNARMDACNARTTLKARARPMPYIAALL